MRFSLRLMLVFITICGLAAHLWVSYRQLEAARKQARQLIAEVEGEKADFEYMTENLQSVLQPKLKAAQNRLKAIQETRIAAEHIFNETLKKESQIHPRADAISVRAVPTLARPGFFRQDFRVHTNARRGCRLEIRFLNRNDEPVASFFDFDPPSQTSVPLITGHNRIEVLMGQNAHGFISLTILVNGERFECRSNFNKMPGYSYSHYLGEQQRDFVSTDELPQLVRFRPTLQSGDEQRDRTYLELWLRDNELTVDEGEEPTR